jgi:hypothetical protein
VTAIPQYLLSLAGEYRVCSELNKRGVFATVTYGNRKSVDVYAISDVNHRALKIEVKATQEKNFVTSLTQKGLFEDSAHAPDFWVLVQIRPDSADKFTERFFVLAHDELCNVQRTVNEKYATGYMERHGTEPDISKGVDGVRVVDVEKFEDQWCKIVQCLSK